MASNIPKPDPKLFYVAMTSAVTAIGPIITGARLRGSDPLVQKFPQFFTLYDVDDAELRAVWRERFGDAAR